ncbi:MAG: xylulokinase [Thaumarchaeota archaeon]|nr:MAG: xylulokinase [Nitrososphaerota archaeon]
MGTTGDKATLFDPEGNLVASVLKEYETIQPQPVWAEQDPDDWWHAFAESTKELLKISKIDPSDVKAISFSGQMMGCLPVDRHGKPLRRSIIWMDQRSIKQANYILERIGQKEFYKITGNRVSPTYTISKILWVKENEPEIYEKAYKFLQAKDYIILRLTGEYVTDYSDASLAGLMDITKKTWAYELLEELRITTDKLPDLHSSITVAGELDSQIAEEIGLRPGTPIVIGGGDGACAAAGAGVIRPGQAYNYIGASSWISTASDRPLIDPKMRIFNFYHLDPSMLAPTGTMQAAGTSYRWLRDQICWKEVEEAKEKGIDPYQVMDSEAEKVEPGAGKVIFLPYLMGERAPWWNPNARGVFFGLALGHERRNMIRAVLEGITFNLRIIMDVFEEQGIIIENMRVIGGGAKGRLWREIMANIYGKRIMVLKYLIEATSLGAAIAAGIGAKLYKDFSVAERLNTVVDTSDPDPKLHEKYEKLYQFFKKLYLTLEPLFDELASIDI